MKDPNHISDDVGLLVASQEARVSILTRVLQARAERGDDTVEDREALWRAMDALDALRRQQWMAHEMRFPE